MSLIINFSIKNKLKYRIVIKFKIHNSIRIINEN